MCHHFLVYDLVGKVIFLFTSVALSGETGMIKFMRGFLGICFLLGIAVYFATAVLFEPIRETAFAPIKELRTTTWDPNMIKIDFPATWNIIATLPVRLFQGKFV